MPDGDDALRELCFSDRVFRDRYKGWAVLGRGSLATVVRTFSRDAGQDIALKLFLNLDPEKVERIRQEVRAAQRLASPYLVQTYSLFHRGAITWFEMELVEGPDLQQELDRLAARREAFPLARAYEIALAVSRCLWRAHRSGLLHRDVKPANLLLPVSGQPVAKLTDFGIARLAAAGSLTPPGSISGTPLFASPEALAGRKVGPAHDVYGLCLTLYALFSGRSPFPVEQQISVTALLRLRVRSRPTGLGTLRPELDVSVSRLIMRGLSPQPYRRPRIERLVFALERARG